MKKAINIAIFCIFTLAQPLFGQKVSLGLSGSANLTFWKWNIVDLGNINYDPGINYRIALPVQYQIRPYIALRAELALNHRSYQGLEITDSPGSEMKGRSGQTNRSIEGSLLAVFQPVPRLKNIYLLGGASLGYVVRRWIFFDKNAQEILGVSRRMDITEAEAFERNQWTLDAGFGYKYSFEKCGQLFAEIRGQFNTNDLVTHNLAEVHFNSIMLTTGYVFRF